MVKLLSNYELALQEIGKLVVEKAYLEQLYNNRDSEAIEYWNEKEQLKEKVRFLELEVNRLEFTIAMKVEE